MSARRRVVTIDATPSAATRYAANWVVVGIDVFRATTVLCTAASLGRLCSVAADMTEAKELAAGMPGALLGGEQSGAVPPGFDLGNSPAEIAARDDVERPLVLVTSSGTPLLRNATCATAVYAACLRNITAQVRHVLSLDLDVAVIGAGTGGSRREEDDFACARIAAGLLAEGYDADSATYRAVKSYGQLSVDWCASGPSARFLRNVGRQDDIDFVLSHVNDLDMVFEVRGTRVLPPLVDVH